jgi:hypothetical protein
VKHSTTELHPDILGPVIKETGKPYCLLLQSSLSIHIDFHAASNFCNFRCVPSHIIVSLLDQLFNYFGNWQNHNYIYAHRNSLIYTRYLSVQ